MKENIMQTPAVSQPIKIGDVLWRQSPTKYIAQQTGVKGNGQVLDSDKLSISSEASVLAAIQKGQTSGSVVKTKDLLTNAEKQQFEKMSRHYGGKKDSEIGVLAMNLAMDKVMAFASKTEIPTINKDYLLGIMDHISNDTQDNSLHSRLDTSFLSDLLDNSYLLMNK